MIISRKRFEEEVFKRVAQEESRRYDQARFERIEKRLSQLESEVFNVRLKADPEFAARNTPVCGGMND